MDPIFNINVFSACSKDQQSNGMSQSGGLLSLCILASDSKFVERDTKLLMHLQTPFYFVNGMERAERLQPIHIEKLQKAITNVKLIN